MGVALAKQGKKVLCIDFDPQANLTMSMGFQKPDELPYTISNVLERVTNEEDFKLAEGILKHPEKVDLMPSSIQLSSFEASLIHKYGRESMLKQYTEEMKKIYDYVLIDCQPSLNILNINALVAADSIIIPTQPQFFSTKGLEMFFNTVKRVKKKLNPTLKIDGILITTLDKRPNFTRDVVAIVRETYGASINVFKSEIPVSIRAVECGAEGKSIFAHDPKGKVAEAYGNFAKEVEQIGKTKNRNINR